MSLTVLGAPEAAESVVTITVQIRLAGDELPPAASRLISDLEALAGAQARHQVQQAGQVSHGAVSQRAGALQAPGRSLRLVESAGGPGAGPNARQVRQAGGATPSLWLCTGSRLLLRDGVAVQLTRREYDLFQFFCENPRRVFTRAQLLRQVWGYDMVGTERTVDVHVRRLRVKLADCASVITTVRGVGYRLDDDAPVEILVRED